MRPSQWPYSEMIGVLIGGHLDTWSDTRDAVHRGTAIQATARRPLVAGQGQRPRKVQACQHLGLERLVSRTRSGWTSAA